MISNQVSTEGAIKQPFSYYCGGDDWSLTHNSDYWNKNFTSYVTVNNEPTLKTIYAPDPSGFVEPKTAAYTGFHYPEGFNVSGNYNKGWNFYTNGWKTGGTIFFPALGWRQYNGITYSLLEGFGMTVGAADQYNTIRLWFASDRIEWNPMVKYFGFTVRPVLDK